MTCCATEALVGDFEGNAGFAIATDGQKSNGGSDRDQVMRCFHVSPKLFVMSEVNANSRRYVYASSLRN